MLKPIRFQPPNPQRRDPNFEAFQEKIKDKSKNELRYMLFLAVEALALKDQQEQLAKTPAPETPDGAGL